MTSARFLLRHVYLVALYLIATLTERFHLMHDDQFDVFGTDTDEHGSTTDYWDAYGDVVAEAFAVTHDDDELPFLLSDADLDELSEDIDTLPADIDLPAWFAPNDAQPPF